LRWVLLGDSKSAIGSNFPMILVQERAHRGENRDL